jgi:hypothetical protein
MSDAPIIFSGPMVRALLDGRKTMTRRLAWKLPRNMMVECRHGYDACPTCDAPKASPWQKVQPGNRLWVRESCCLTDDGDHEYAIYAADPGAVERHRAQIDLLGPCFPKKVADQHRKLRPAIHMPRWASRLTLTIAAVKIERLQDISEADAIAEGMTEHSDRRSWWDGTDLLTAATSARGAFYLLWQKLHGPKSWDANPEVVALTFTVHKCNIDQMKEAA